MYCQPLKIGQIHMKIWDSYVSLKYLQNITRLHFHKVLVCVASSSYHTRTHHDTHTVRCSFMFTMVLTTFCLLLIPSPCSHSVSSPGQVGSRTCDFPDGRTSCGVLYPTSSVSIPGLSHRSHHLFVRGQCHCYSDSFDHNTFYTYLYKALIVHLKNHINNPVHINDGLDFTSS